MSAEIRNNVVYHDCYGCGKEFMEDDVSWATIVIHKDGKLTMVKNDPYCDACLPEEGDDG